MENTNNSEKADKQNILSESFAENDAEIDPKNGLENDPEYRNENLRKDDIETEDPLKKEESIGSIFPYRLIRSYYYVILIMIGLNFLNNWELLIMQTWEDSPTFMILFPEPFPLISYFIPIQFGTISPLIPYSAITILREIISLVTVSFFSGGLLGLMKKANTNFRFRNYLEYCQEYFGKMIVFNIISATMIYGGVFILTLISPIFAFIGLIAFNFCTFLVPFIIVLLDKQVLDSFSISIHYVMKKSVIGYLVGYIIIFCLCSLLIQGLALSHWFGAIIAFISVPFLSLYMIQDLCGRINSYFRVAM